MIVLSTDRDFAEFLDRINGRDLAYQRFTPSAELIAIRTYDAQTAGLRTAPVRKKRPTKPDSVISKGRQLEIALVALANAEANQTAMKATKGQAA